MSDESRAEHTAAASLATLRVIVLGLASGVLVFLTVVLFAGPGNAQPGRLWTIMAVLAGLAVVGRAIVPPLMLRHFMQQISQGTWQSFGSRNRPMPTTAEEQLMMAYTTITIVSCALLEGAAFANVYAYQVEQHWASLTIACGLVGLMLLHFPVRSRVDSWIEGRLRWLREDRDLNPSQRHDA